MTDHDVLAEAYDMGYEAAIDGGNESYCPFHPASEKWELWMQGFEAAKDMILDKSVEHAAWAVNNYDDDEAEDGE